MHPKCEEEYGAHVSCKYNAEICIADIAIWSVNVFLQFCCNFTIATVY
jgi:hypothetical protein